MKSGALKDQADRHNKEAIAKWQSLLNQEGDYLDEDGYPTELACEIIKHWHWSDEKGWFEFIKNLWYLSSWGWKEVVEDSDWKDEQVQRYYISTAGWSGNETLIEAMQENFMLWSLTWVQSRRGGHYIFQLYDYQGE